MQRIDHKLQDFDRQLKESDNVLRLMATISQDRLNEILHTLEHTAAGAAHWDSPEGKHNLEEIQAKLRSTLHQTTHRPYEHDPLCFRFVIPSQSSSGAQNVIARLELDTGAMDNWIRLSVVERAGISLERVDDARTFVGAGGARFTACG